MPSQVELDRMRERLESDFIPLSASSGGGLEADAALRQAHALEHIAFSIGRISQKLDALIEASSGSKS